MEIAERELRAAVALSPNSADLHAQLGFYLARNGDSEGSLTAFRTAAQLDPANPHFRVYYGDSLARSGDPASGASEIRAATQLEPENAEFMAILGNVLCEIGEFSEAEEVFGNAVRLAPAVARFHAYYGNALARRGSINEAEAEIQRALEIEPENEEFKLILRNIQRKKLELAEFEGDFIVAGHSHMYALGALDSSESYAGKVKVIPRMVHGRSIGFLVEDWITGRTAEYWNELMARARNRTVLLIYNGNQHYANFLLSTDPLFDFLEHPNSAETLQSGAFIVPRRLIKAHFAHSLIEMKEVVRRLQRSEARSVLILGTPAPKEDINRFWNEIKNSDFFKARAAARGLELETVTPTPANILLKMWRVLQELMEEIALENGAQFVPVPAESLTEAGFLREIYYADSTHANNAYGELVLATAIPN